MAEYINKKAAVGILEAMSKNTDCGAIEKRLKAAAKRIGGLYAPEVAPTVNGKWIIDECEGGDPEYYSASIKAHCSECGFYLWLDEGDYGWFYNNPLPDPFPFKYCPNCGAKMDGGVSE